MHEKMCYFVSQPLYKVRNLGPKSALMLAEAGIRSLDELKMLGAVKAYAWVKARRSKFASLNLLWALAAGLEDRDWRELTTEEKEGLVAELKSLR
jgi:DNA transformation protein and related proteins